MCGLFLAVALAAGADGIWGLDLLYGDQVPLLQGGEPLVTVGIASGERRVRLRGDVPITAEFYEAGVLKRAVVPANKTVTVSVKRAQAATRQHFVDLGGVTPSTAEAQAQALELWRQRGQRRVAILQEGVLLGIGGRLLDNRDVRAIVTVGSNAQASHLAGLLGRRFGGQFAVRQRLAERPWGELALTGTEGPLGLATTYVRLRGSGGTIEVDSVEYARGYAWHNRANRRYRGDVYAVVDPNGTLAVVNAVGAETLLRGVVPAEIYASAPPAALQAQAVAARNILLAKLGKRHHTDPFHLCAEQHCQVFEGVGREDPRTNAAIAATIGQALFFRGRLVDAVYSSSCGGHTEDNDAVWGEAPNPALRGRPDFDVGDPAWAPFATGITAGNVGRFVGAAVPSFCNRASGKSDRFRWHKSVGADELRAWLGRAYPALGPLRNVQVSGRGHGGRVTALRLDGERSSVTVQRELPIRQLFGNLHSAAFDLDVRHDARGQVEALYFRGGGWGHGVGMCQLGAIGRAEAGHPYSAILAHYYGGARLERLYDGRPHEAPRLD